jgi:hypothetical protein
VHLRRALLLFAIVLGLAAVAASVSRDRDGSGDRAEQPAPPPSTGSSPTVSPGPASEAGVELTFRAERSQTRRLEAGQPATLQVQVDEPGQVEIPELGLNGSADPLTPARFELLVPDPGRYEIDFTPAAGDEADDAGTLVVVDAEA